MRMLAVSTLWTSAADIPSKLAEVKGSVKVSSKLLRRAFALSIVFGDGTTVTLAKVRLSTSSSDVSMLVTDTLTTTAMLFVKSCLYCENSVVFTLRRIPHNTRSIFTLLHLNNSTISPVNYTSSLESLDTRLLLPPCLFRVWGGAIGSFCSGGVMSGALVCCASSVLEFFFFSSLLPNSFQILSNETSICETTMKRNINASPSATPAKTLAV